MSEHAVLNANYLRHIIMNPSEEQLDKIPTMPAEDPMSNYVNMNSLLVLLL